MFRHNVSVPVRRDGGHLFIIQGDICHLACDAWLLPTDRWGHITSAWSEVKEVRANLEGSYLKGLPAGWKEGSVRTFPLKGLRPTPWATRVGGRKGTPLDWYVSGLEAFVVAASAHTTSGSGVERERPLLAVPLVGTGHGGASFRKGSLTEAMILSLLNCVRTNRVDVALVLNDSKSFAAAQAVRWRLEAEGATPWSSLSRSLTDKADQLAIDAMLGRLVVFFGSGVSAGAGLPGWDRLLDAVAADAHLSATERRRLRNMDHRDQARVLEMHLKDQSLRESVRQHLRGDRYSLAHSLLANLPAREFVTTNFDQLFESAWHDCRGPLRVLPYQSDGSGSAWLLKLHGSLEKDDIVLTRADYLQNMRNRGALSAIVQAMLITRHMVFVGYSLRDDDFLEVVDDVRSAIGPLGRSVGTALMAEPAGFLNHLWRNTLEIVSASDESSVRSIAKAGRLIDILLDRLVAQAMRTSSAFVMDPTFDELLTPSERSAIEKIREVADSLDVKSPVGGVVRRILDQLGGETSK